MKVKIRNEESWRKAEEIALNYIRENYDKNAEGLGGSNSSKEDIYCSLGLIEVKNMDAGAQCGQFTRGTAEKYLFSDLIIKEFENLGFKNNATLKNHDLCKRWVENYYLNIKKVNYFAIVFNGQVELLTPEEFFSTYDFECTYRFKGSGSSKAAKWVEKYVPDHWNCERKNEGLYALNEKVLGESAEGKNTKGETTIFFVGKNNEVRIQSKTKNETFIFSINFKEN